MNCIIDENKDFVVVDKPWNTPSEKDKTQSVDMTELLNLEFSSREEHSTAFVVHRLDRVVGGLMVYAKNQKSASELSATVSNKDIFKKEYTAVISGVPEANSGNFVDFIYKDSKLGKAFITDSKRNSCKEAKLDYTLCKTIELDGKTFSLVKIKLNTGRFHQIRVQFASRKMPIWGDGKYGSREKLDGIALCSTSLSFEYKGKTYSYNKDVSSIFPFSLFN